MEKVLSINETISFTFFVRFVAQCLYSYWTIQGPGSVVYRRKKKSKCINTAIWNSYMLFICS